jgi:4-nitrophenyl phosphatase
VKPYRLYILDLDGTLYRGAEAIPGAVETVQELRNRGALIRFLTNNSGQTQEFYREKLHKLGFAAELDEIYSSALGAAKVCAAKGLKSIFYVGEEGLRLTLEEAGLSVLKDTDSQAEAVVAGICRSFSYGWLNGALQQLFNGAEFVATNTDATYPLENGKVEPGAGAIVAAIAAASGKPPEVIGKPNPLLINMILKEAGVAASDALAVGDRVETDILSGINAGVDTHLVLTGVTHTVPEGQSSSVDLRGLLD